MRKIILLCPFITMGLLNAKNTEERKPTKVEEKKEIIKYTEASKTDALYVNKKMNCYEYAMYIPCTDLYIIDTQCWGPGSGTATWDDAWNCIRLNGSMAIEFFCGS